MARRTTLVKLLDDLRSETRTSFNPAHNPQVRDMQVRILQRTQERLWGDFAWPHLRVFRFIPVQNGQRYYAPPEDIDIDRITRVEARWDQVYRPVQPGIDPGHYAAYDSDLDHRGSPVMRWQITEDEQIELWPIPDVDANPQTREGEIRITGIRTLRPLVKDDDRADLDDRLIVLYAAAELLAGSGARDATLKLAAADAHYAKMKSNLTPRRQFRMFNTEDTRRPRERIPFAVYNSRNGS